MKGPFRLGVDVGGTFTDLALWDYGTDETHTEKVLTTPQNPAVGVLEGVQRLLAADKGDPSLIERVVHGTTLVSNTLIERKGAKTGLITTHGFRDVLTFGRELRYNVYDPEVVFPEPLIPRQWRMEVTERVDGRGRTLVELTRNEATQVVQRLLKIGVESVAIVLLHSYLNADHELYLRDLIYNTDPGVHVSLSHEVLPQIREYERTSATAINAYVKPIVNRYLTDLETGLRELGIAGDLHLMTSGGGAISVERASQFPIQLLESGPAAGVLMAAAIGASAGERDVFAFDMGGTTAKCCVVRQERPLISRDRECARVSRFSKGSGLPVGIPMVDLLEVGAGGGSIAEIDAVGLLTVGPRSAGADPGPACYSLGGTSATVTDADAILGFLDPSYFLGGDMRLDVQSAKQCVESEVAEPLGLSQQEAAVAVVRVAAENMSEAARVHSVERNVDIRNFTLVAFGGAGPLHAYRVAKRLGIHKIIIPPNAGVLSALGLLRAPLAIENSRSLAQDLNYLDIPAVNALLEGLEEEGTLRLASAGVRNVAFERSVDMCYEGQGFEVTTPLVVERLTIDSLEELKDTFDRVYEEAFGRWLPEVPARCVTWRVLARDADETTRYDGQAFSQPGTSNVTPTRREVTFPEFGTLQALVHNRSDLSGDEVISGPAIIQERVSTTVVPPDMVARVDARGNLVLEFTSSAKDGYAA